MFFFKHVKSLLQKPHSHTALEIKNGTPFNSSMMKLYLKKKNLETPRIIIIKTTTGFSCNEQQ